MTQIEAEAILQVISEVLDHPDAIEAKRDGGVDVAAAFRFREKLRRAAQEKFG